MTKYRDAALRVLIFNEANQMDDYGNLVLTQYVDLRNSQSLPPSTSLIKGCRPEHAIEISEVIRISKPSYFRSQGEGLIKDPEEMRAATSTVVSKQVNHPTHLAEARLRDDEFNRASEILESPMKLKVNTKHVSVTHKETSAFTFGRNGWMFCASMQPEDEEQRNNWRSSVQSDYHHVSHIHRPRAFAMALGLMVAEQLGPQGQEGRLTNTFNDEIASRTTHKTQTIYHGPVVYVDSPYELFSNASSDVERLFLPLFVKGMAHQDQREYRFIIWAESEPPDDDEVVDLDVSLAMLSAMTERPQSRRQEIVPVTIAPDRAGSTSRAGESQACYASFDEGQDGRPALANTGLFPSLLGMLGDVSIPRLIGSSSDKDLPLKLREEVTTYSVMKELRALVGELTGGLDFSSERVQKVSSAAWHAEPLLRRLCSTFDDPFKSIYISEDNFVVVNLKFPDGIHTEARLAFGPYGTASCVIVAGRKSSHSRMEDARSMADKLEKDLKETGLPIRHRHIHQRLRERIHSCVKLVKFRHK